jgi:hypothetical protein
MAADDFGGTARFEVRRRLGAGSYGVVYEAYDRERELSVALKVLRDGSADAVYQFKREFRALADITHPNLVSLYELLGHGDEWFFTMELLAGDDLIRWIRGPDQPPLAAADLDKVRDGFAQLTAGIRALHEAGKLHRDLKPSNVLVTPSGRVVVLDFGLVAEVTADDPSASTRVRVVGTPAYMSPEQAGAAAATAARDWYAVGVMLFQALTGRLPFEGSSLQILSEKQHREPVAVRDLVPSTPADLDRLCARLLRPDPGGRPAGAEVQAQLGTSRRAESAGAAARRAPFVGREPELNALDNALTLSKEGHAIIVFVHGASGMGKTALVRRFLEVLADREAVTILAGRCYEQESVPYKAFDSLVDALSQQLRRMPTARVESVLPLDIIALSRLFPVLRRVDAVAGARRRQVTIPDPQELRRRAFSAFRELLARLAEHQPVVLFVDDLQWGDADSALLFQELVRPPDPPSILLIGSYRTDEAATSPMLKRLREGDLLGQARIVEIKVGGLSPREARALAEALVKPDQKDWPGHVDAIRREAGGSPLFIRELVRYFEAESNAGASEVALEQVIRARVSRLPEPASRLLAIVAMAGRPVRADIARRAAGIDTDEYSVITLLRRAQLLRTREVGDNEELEMYHDRIRETVVAAMSPDSLRTLNRRLAVALEEVGQPDAESLAVHLQGAGDLARAAHFAAIAADQAAEALAFDRAARLYRRALELGSQDQTGVAQDLRTKLARSLANAGRGGAAAAAYLLAAGRAHPTHALELRRLAAEQLLISGHIDAGISALRDVLRQTGMTFPSSPRRALLSLLLRRFRLRWRGLRFREREASTIPPDQLTRVDTCWSIAVGLGLVDTMRGNEFQTRHLLLALELGEPYRIARALAVEGGYSSLDGLRGQRRTESILRAAQTLAERINHPHAIGLAILTSGIAASLEQRWRHGLELFERALRILTDHCTGVAWELDTCAHNMLRNLTYLGRWLELARRLPAHLKDAQERGDLYLETALRIRATYVAHLAADRPDAARHDVTDSLERWAQPGFQLEHYWATVVEPEIELYAGRVGAAQAKLARWWPALVDSFFLRAESARSESFYLRGRVRLLAASEDSGSDRLRALNEAERDALRIEKDKVPAADGTAALLRAAAAALRGQREEAMRLFTVAEARLAGSDMLMHATAARRARGRLLGGDHGASLVAEADSWMREQGVVRPDCVARMLCPGIE